MGYLLDPLGLGVNQSEGQGLLDLQSPVILFMDLDSAVVLGIKRFSNALLLHRIRATVFQFQVTADFVGVVLE